MEWERKQTQCPQCILGPTNFLCPNCEAKYIPDFSKLKPKPPTTQQGNIKFSKIRQFKEGPKRNISLAWQWPPQLWHRGNGTLEHKNQISPRIYTTPPLQAKSRKLKEKSTNEPN